MKILCTADLHLGRESSRIPEDKGAHSSSQAWERIVKLAIQQRVQLVAVAGDLIDAAANYFHAAGPLQRGLEKLLAEGIDCALIAGNHDYDALPRFLKGFLKSHPTNKIHLLGANGGWEHRLITLSNGEKLNLVGQSFQSENQTADPFSSPFPEINSDGVPTLGLLHADVDQRESRYGPCSSQRLLTSRPDVWLLGHIHVPKFFNGEADKLVFYPGSPQALDPGERGEHGIRIVELLPHTAPTISSHQISSVFYEILDVHCPAEASRLVEVIEEAIYARLAQIATLDAAPEIVGFRIRLTGRTPLHQQLMVEQDNLLGDLQEFRPSHSQIEAFIDGSILFETRPDLDLEALSKGTSPAALLANTIRSLENGEHPPFLETMERQISAAFNRMQIGAASGEETRDLPPDTRALLITEGYKLLAQLEETK